MDNKIYYPGQREFGVYATRRIPRGHGISGALGGAGAGLGGDAVATGVQSPAGGPGVNANPVGIALSGGGVFGSHGTPSSQLNFQYTVPPNRRAMIQAAMVRMIRRTVAAPIGEYASFIRISRVNQSGVPMLALAWLATNGVGDHSEDKIGGPLELLPGDTLSYLSYDLSTGGTVAHGGDVLLLEYDEQGKSGVPTNLSALELPNAAAQIVNGQQYFPVGGTGAGSFFGVIDTSAKQFASSPRDYFGNVLNLFPLR